MPMEKVLLAYIHRWIDRYMHVDVDIVYVCLAAAIINKKRYTVRNMTKTYRKKELVY